MKEKTRMKYEKIIQECDNILSYDSKNTEALCRKAEYLFNLKRYDESLNVLSHDSKNTKALFKKAEYLFNLKRYDESIECYNSLNHILHNDPNFWLKKGIVLAELKKLDEAESAYKNAYNLLNSPEICKLESNNEYAKLWGKLGEFLFDINNFDLAINAVKFSNRYQRLCIKEFNIYLKEEKRRFRKRKAIKTYQIMRNQKNDNPDEWYNLGKELEICEEPNKSEYALKKAVELYYEIGHNSLNLHLYQKAIDYFEKILYIDPSFLRAWTRSAIILTKLGQLDKALEYCDKALKINQLDSEAWYFRGNILLKLKKYTDSMNSYNKSLEINPDFSEALHKKGLIYSELGNYQEALELYEKAIKLKGDRYVIWCNKCFVLAKLERYEEALAACEISLELKPDYYKSLYNKASILEKIGKKEEAKFVYNEFINISYYLGNFFYTRREFQKAIEHFDSILKIEPDHAGSLGKKGSILFELGKFDGSLKLVNKAVSLDPKWAEGWFIKGEIENSHDFHTNAIQLNPKLSERKSCFKKYNFNREVEETSHTLNKVNEIENWYDERNYVNRYGLYK